MYMHIYKTESIQLYTKMYLKTDYNRRQSLNVMEWNNEWNNVI